MKTFTLFLLLLNLWLTCLALKCRVVPGKLTQVDAGNGQVFGVNANGDVYTLHSKGWVLIPGSLRHVSVGPAGVWGVNSGDYIFRLERGDWVVSRGLLTQIDAGGSTFPAGVNKQEAVYCLPGHQGMSWTNIPGKLKYCSCGPNSCWGVNSISNVFIMKGVTQTSCGGSSKWEQIPGALSMIEVSTDGMVFGVNSSGDIYQREGISSSNPAGTKWRQIPLYQRIKHLSYDLGHLWLIGTDSSIMDCTDLTELEGQ